MSVGLIVPALILSTVVVAAPIVLAMDRRERRLYQQIQRTTALANPDAAQQQNIRREKVRFLRLREIVRSMACYDPDFPEAYSQPVPLVLVVGLLAGLAAGVFAATALSVPLSVAIGMLVAGMAVRGLFGWQRDRYCSSLRRQLPDALQFVVGAVRAGFPVMEALRGLAREAPEPTRGRFDEVLNDISVGRPVNEALLNLYHRTRVTEYAIFAVTLAVQTKSGGHIAETIQALAETIRERITIAARAKALAGEGTVSATILCILPIVTGVALSLIQPGYLEPLFADPRGKRLFLFGVAALLAGMWSMRKMITGAVKE
jgi:tight adherence protein B